MATRSYLAAARDLYDSLTPALFPGGVLTPSYFAKPVQVAGGAQVRPPYVVIADTGSTPEHQSDNGGPETGGLEVTAYAATLADVDAIVAAVKWNGQPPGERQGFDGGTLTLDAPLYHLSLLRTKELRSYDGDDKTGARVHKCVITYQIVQATDPTATPA